MGRLKKLPKYLTTMALGLGVSISAQAVVISQGSLSIDVNTTNGNLDEVSFLGNPYYDLGFPVSDWGLQVGSNTTTFTTSTNRSSLNPFGFSSVATTAGVGSTATGGTYTEGGVDIGLSRNYSFVPGQDAFMSTTEIINNADLAVTLRLFETYDPDQGPGSSTSNNRELIDAVTVLTHINGGLAGLLSDLPSSTASAGGFLVGDLGITSGTELNNFFTTGGTDPNGSTSDVGFALGWEFTLGAGERVSISSLQCYGEGLESVTGCNTGEVSTPATAMLLGMGLLSLVTTKRIRRRKNNTQVS